MENRIRFLVNSGKSKLKITPLFENGHDAEHFEVDAERIKHFSKLIRQYLGKISQLYKHGQPSEDHVLDVLRGLAVLGTDLRNALFREPGAKLYTDQIANEKLSVTFLIDAGINVHVPYGLMYGSPAETHHDFPSLREEDFKRDFWCSRYRVASLYCPSDDLSDYEADGQTYSLHGPDTSVFGAFHPEAINFADREAFDRWPQEATVYSGSHFRTHWPLVAPRNALLYFFCHSDGKALFFANSGDSYDDTLTPYDFEACLQRSSNRLQRGLVILNGCKTGISDTRASWLSTTCQFGLLGFIGTEGPVPTRFAWPFGNDIMALILNGTSPADAMCQLRDRHWPLSLLYGLYCMPNIRVEPPVEAKFLRSVQKINYSPLSALEADHPHSTLPFTVALRSRRARNP